MPNSISISTTGPNLNKSLPEGFSSPTFAPWHTASKAKTIDATAIEFPATTGA
jgi:hypothetical protein